MTREVGNPTMPAVSYATLPYWLSLIGGALILIGGILLALAGPFLLAYNAGVGALAIGILGIIFGIVILWAANNLRTNAAAHVTYGAVIVIVAVLAFIFTGGGFVIGSILAFVGGVLAIIPR